MKRLMILLLAALLSPVLTWHSRADAAGDAALAPHTVDAAQILGLYEAVWIEGRTDLVDKLLAPDVVRHQPVSVRPPEVDGRDAYRAYIEQFRGMHPDLQVEVKDVVASANQIAYRYSASAFMDPQKTRRFSYTGITIARIDDQGRIAEEWLTWDTYDLMSQVGLVQPRQP